MVINTVSFDHPDPSIFTVLTSPSGQPGVANVRFRHLPAALAGGRAHVPPALVPPQRDERADGPRARRLRVQGGRLPAGRRVDPQLPAGPRPGRADLREGERRRAQAAQARELARLHVGVAATSSARRSSRWARRNCKRTTTTPGAASRSASSDAERHARSAAEQLGRESANDPGCDFPIQNLPFGIFRKKGGKERPRGGVAIGDQILDLDAVGLNTGPTLNILAAAGRPPGKRCARLLSDALSDPKNRKKFSKYLVPMKKAELFLPVAIGDYSDFYTGIHHAHHGRQDVPPRQSAAAELPLGADRLSRARLLDRRQRHAGRSPERSDEGHRTRPRPCSARASAWISSSNSASSSGRATRSASRCPISKRDGPRVRRGAVQRLVGARHPGLGIPAARAVPRQELRLHGVAVDRHHGSARALPLRGLRPRAGRPARAAALPVRTRPTSAKAATPSTWRCTCAARRCARGKCRRSA